MTVPADHRGWLRIGELSRRVGVSEHVLRAWERRYGLLRPSRSPGGYRLYSQEDERRVRSMRALLQDGLSAAEAARRTLEDTAAPPPAAAAGPDTVDAWTHRLAAAMEALDEPAAQDVLDGLLARLTVEAALRDVVLPYLHGLGERWERGEVTVTQEHFATQVLRGRLTALSRGWGRGVGPRALLACPPGERHDVALLAFGVVLARSGWSVTFLGPDTPVESLGEALRARPADVVVLAVTEETRLSTHQEELRALAQRVRLLLAGPGATGDVARTVGAAVLPGDPVTAAQTLAP